MQTLVILTWISGSWKTTLQNELINRGWVKPINFTTRKPRTDERNNELFQNKTDWLNEDENVLLEDFNSEELNEYTFLTEKQYFHKLVNWDFLEFTNWYWNWYWVSKYIPEDKKCIVILDPIWRAQVMEKAARLWWKVITFYLDVNKEEQIKRLTVDRPTDKATLEKRLKDNLRFWPTDKCILLNWETSIKTNADIIEANYKKNV